MVIDRGDYLEAIFLTRDGQSRSLREGDQIEAWTVSSLSMYGMTITQEDQKHEFPLD